MIELINVSKYYPTDFGRHYVFRDVSLALPPDKSVGVLGPNGAGKSTFLRLLGGADMPTEGRILRTGRISPPMGLTPGLQATLTGSENARFAGRIYGLQRDEINDLIEYVRELANIGKYFEMPVGTYSAGMRQRVSFAINMSMNFDYYLFDEIGAGGDKEFRQTANAMVKERLKTSKFIIASHRSDELLNICDAGIVIQNGELTFYDDIKDALAAYGGEDEKPDRRAKRAKRRGTENSDSDAALAASPQPEAADSAVDAEGTDQVSRRERRRRKRGLVEQDVAVADAPAPEPEALAAAPESVVADEELDARRERRRRKRELVEQVATEAEAPAPEPEALATAPETPVADEERKARQEQRRLKREIRQARLRSEAEISKTSEAGAIAGVESALPDPQPKISAAPAPLPVPAKAATAPPVGSAPFAQRIKSRPPEPENLQQLKPAAASPDPTPAAKLRRPETPPPLRPAGSKSLLLQRALRRQERSQITAARAARLLLQYLDETAAAGQPSQARAWLVAAAQETAALEAVQARQMLDSIASSEASGEAAIRVSDSPSFTTGGSSVAGQTRSGFVRPARMANPD